MEYASYLAGERWSDHPVCTHPLLGSVARLVNDSTPDGERQELLGLVPSVIGLCADDPRWDLVIARRAAIEALPYVAERRQRVLAVAIVVAERHLDALDDRPPGTLDPVSAEALARAPAAWSWARAFAGAHPPGSLADFRRRSAPSVVVSAIAGLAESCSAPTTPRLRQLLSAAIADCEALLGDRSRPAAELAPLPPTVPRRRFRHKSPV